MKKSLLLTATAAASVVLVLAGCAKPPSSGPAASGAPSSAPASAATSAPAGGQTSAAAPTAANANFKACMISDTGGFSDKSFNQTSYKGMSDAKKALGIQTASVESKAASDYATNIQSMVNANCNVIITVGYTRGTDFQPGPRLPLDQFVRWEGW